MTKKDMPSPLDVWSQEDLETSALLRRSSLQSLSLADAVQEGFDRLFEDREVSAELALYGVLAAIRSLIEYSVEFGADMAADDFPEGTREERVNLLLGLMTFAVPLEVILETVSGRFQAEAAVSALSEMLKATGK